jgi:predicted CXXCH cytochrome family protein
MHASTFVPGGHKIAADFDPRRTDREFTCASCHNPHGADNPKLFYFGGDEFEMCDGCHGDRTGKHKELKDIHRNKKPKVSPDAGAAPPPDAGAADGSAAPRPDAGPAAIAAPDAGPAAVAAPDASAAPAVSSADAGSPAKPDAGPAPSYPVPDAGTPLAGPPKGKEDKK